MISDIKIEQEYMIYDWNEAKNHITVHIKTKRPLCDDELKRLERKIADLVWGIETEGDKE